MLFKKFLIEKTNIVYFYEEVLETRVLLLNLIEELGVFFWILIVILYIIFILNLILISDVSTYSRLVWVIRKFSQVVLVFLLIFYVVDSLVDSRFVVVRAITINIYRFLVLMYFFKNFKFFIFFLKSTSTKKKRLIVKFFLPVTRSVFIELRRLFLMVGIKLWLMLAIFLNRHNVLFIFFFLNLVFFYIFVYNWSLLLDKEISKFNPFTLSPKNTGAVESKPKKRINFNSLGKKFFHSGRRLCSDETYWDIIFKMMRNTTAPEDLKYNKIIEILQYQQKSEILEGALDTMSDPENIDVLQPVCTLDESSFQAVNLLYEGLKLKKATMPPWNESSGYIDYQINNERIVNCEKIINKHKAINAKVWYLEKKLGIRIPSEMIGINGDYDQRKIKFMRKISKDVLKVAPAAAFRTLLTLLKK